MSHSITRKIFLGSCAAVLATFALSGVALADREHDGRVFDQRYHHDHYYPSRGAEFRVVPRAAITVRFGGNPYYFHEGVWYRPHGPRFAVVAPPFGLFVPVLPPFYTTVWARGVPYYYANDVYYAWNPERNGYIVTQPPEESEIVTQPQTASAPASGPVGDQLFTYPKKGQSEQQQATDRYECHSWAANQTQYDPSQVANPSSSETRERRTAYTRAMTACLEGRDYSVK